MVHASSPKASMSLLVVAVGQLAGISGCESQSRTIEYVVPVGYRGVFLVVEDPSSNGWPTATPTGIRLSIPDDGVLILDEFPETYEYHQSIARFADGTTIPSGDGAPAGSVQFLVLQSSTRGNLTVHWYAVGTRGQIEDRFRAEIVEESLRNRLRGDGGKRAL